VGLHVANVTVIVLKLTLNEKIGVGGRGQIKSIVVFAGSLAIERDLEIFAAGLIDRYVIGVEFHRGRLASVHLGDDGQSIAALPKCFTHPLVRLLPTHRQPQCQDT
jgi:hypothetical protein